MFFGLPIYAWFLLSLPIIIAMYLLKKKYRDTPVSSHMLWEEALQEQVANNRMHRLRRSLLLIMQLIIALLIVSTLMQPLFWRNGSLDGHVAIVFDTSASMSASLLNTQGNTSFGEAPTYFTKAKQELSQYLAEAMSSVEAVSLIATGAEPTVLSLRETNLGAVQKQVQALELDAGYSDNVAALSLADALVREDENGQIVLVTDQNWPDLASVQAVPLHAPVRVFDVAAQDMQLPRDSATLASFGVKMSEVSGQVDGVVTVYNGGDFAERVDVTVAAGNRDKWGEWGWGAPLTVSSQVEPGTFASMAVKNLPPAAVYQAVASGDLRDRYITDNTRYAFIDAEQTQRVLLVTDGNVFLEQALALADVELIQVKPAQFDPSNPAMRDNVAWIVLDGLASTDLSGAGWSDLLQTQSVLRLAAAGGTGTAQGDLRLAEHPLTQYLSMNDVHIGQIDENLTLTGGQAVLTDSASQPLVYANEQGGKRQVTFTFSLQDSDLTLRAEFPVLMLNIAQWMGGASAAQIGEVVAGERLEITYNMATAQAAWLPLAVEGSDGAALRVEGFSEGGKDDAPGSAAPAAVRVPRQTGLYALQEQDASGATLGQRYLSVTSPVDEFLGTSVSDLALQGGEGAVTGVTEGVATEPLGRYFMLVLLVLLVVEWRLYQRGL